MVLTKLDNQELHSIDSCLLEGVAIGRNFVSSQVMRYVRTQLLFCRPISDNFDIEVFSKSPQDRLMKVQHGQPWQNPRKHRILFVNSHDGYPAYPRITYLTTVMRIPLQTPPKLGINLRKKISLIVLFAFGTVAIVAAIVRCILFVRNATLIEVLTWSGIEQAVCSVVTNTPLLRPLFFRGKHFESTEGHGVPSGARPHDIYEMGPKDTGFVSVAAMREEDALRPATGVLQKVEVTRTFDPKGSLRGRL
jgi:hypothetical protein